MLHLHFFTIGNGFISTGTLKEILKELDNKLTDDDLENIIEEVDEDGSGTLDFDGELLICILLGIKYFKIMQHMKYI